MHFQATFNRHADAPRDQQQPTSISSASAPLTANTRFTVTGTVFGGPGDDQAVAYSDVAPGWASRPGVALPFQVPRPAPEGCRIGKRQNRHVSDRRCWSVEHQRPLLDDRHAPASRVRNGHVGAADERRWHRSCASCGSGNRWSRKGPISLAFSI